MMKELRHPSCTRDARRAARGARYHCQPSKILKVGDITTELEVIFLAPPSDSPGTIKGGPDTAVGKKKTKKRASLSDYRVLDGGF